jgi:8-oxo-dGTP pyrophosphatase MutT (NUDIX family)
MVPGGNKEDTDSSLLATATRETREELGSVVPLEVKAQILTK